MDSPVHREVALSIIALLNNLTFERSALIKDWKDFDDVEPKRDDLMMSVYLYVWIVSIFRGKT